MSNKRPKEMVTAVFRERVHANMAFDWLRAHNYSTNDINVLMSDHTLARFRDEDDNLARAGNKLEEGMATGGAIGVISATRIGYHPSNMKLADLFHRRLFRSGRSHVPVGMALVEAKQDLWQARFALSTRQLKDYSQIPATRRTIARILTVQRESPFDGRCRKVEHRIFKLGAKVKVMP